MNRWMRSVRMWGVGLLVVGATACATPTANRGIEGPNGELPTSRLELDPMLIEASKNGEPGRALNADEVFRKAYEAYQARNYEEALKHYGAVIKYFPDSRFLLPSLFNSGLSSEKLERWDDAAKHYQAIIERFPRKKDAVDAYYRLASAYEKLSEHQKIVDLMTTVMLRPDLKHFDRIEAHVRRANAMLELGQYKQAADGFRTVKKLNRAAPAPKRLDDDSHYMVQSEFGLGRALHAQVLAIKLTLPPDKMGKDLEAKAEIFLAAQSAYIRALRVHHPQWSVAAGYMIGRLYEDFYLDIFQAEIPTGMSEEQLTLYFEELRKNLRPLMVRAIQVYEKNLSFSQRIDTKFIDNRWAKQSNVHLSRLKSYLNDPFTQRRAQRLVVQGRPLQDLWNPQMMATDVVKEAWEKAKDASTKQRPTQPKS